MQKKCADRIGIKDLLFLIFKANIHTTKNQGHYSLAECLTNSNARCKLQTRRQRQNQLFLDQEYLLKMKRVQFQALFWTGQKVLVITTSLFCSFSPMQNMLFFSLEINSKKKASQSQESFPASRNNVQFLQTATVSQVFLLGPLMINETCFINALKHMTTISSYFLSDVTFIVQCNRYCISLFYY